jgi:hypothetical protein
MTREAFCLAQVGRLRVCNDGRFLDAIAKAELARALSRAAGSQAHVQAVVDHWLDTHADVPAVVELIAACDSVPRVAAPTHSVSCGQCVGGYVVRWYRQIDTSGADMVWRRVPDDEARRDETRPGSGIYSGAAPCPLCSASSAKAS